MGFLEARNKQFRLSARSSDWFIHNSYANKRDGSANNFDLCIIKLRQNIFERSQQVCSNCVSRACLPVDPPVEFSKWYFPDTETNSNFQIFRTKSFKSDFQKFSKLIIM